MGLLDCYLSLSLRNPHRVLFTVPYIMPGLLGLYLAVSRRLLMISTLVAVVVLLEPDSILLPLPSKHLSLPDRFSLVGPIFLHLLSHPLGVAAFIRSCLSGPVGIAFSWFCSSSLTPLRMGQAFCYP